jgi:integrase
VRGHLERRGKDIWRAKVYVGFTDTGGRRYLMQTIHGSKRQAEDVLAQMIVDAGGGVELATRGTVKDLAVRWMRTTRGSLSSTTVSEYQRLLDRLILPRLGRTKLRGLRASDLDAFYADLRAKGGHDGRPLSAATVRHVHAMLRAMLGQGVKWGWLSNNPAARATPPRLNRRPVTPPAPEDVLRLIDSADPDLACYLRLAAVTGARRGELCALRWSDADLRTGTLAISRSIVGRRNDAVAEKTTKTAAGRRIALDTATVTTLKEHRRRCDERAKECAATVASDAYIFSPEPDGSRPWRPDGLTLAFGRLRRRLGLRTVRLHDLRHAAATQMLAAGIPVSVVAGRLGHASPATTLNVYAHWVRASDQVAASVLGDLLNPPPKETSTQTRPRSRRRPRRSTGGVSLAPVRIAPKEAS